MFAKDLHREALAVRVLAEPHLCQAPLAKCVQHAESIDPHVVSWCTAAGCGATSAAIRARTTTARSVQKAAPTLQRLAVPLCICCDTPMEWVMVLVASSAAAAVAAAAAAQELLETGSSRRPVERGAVLAVVAVERRQALAAALRARPDAHVM